MSADIIHSLDQALAYCRKHYLPGAKVLDRITGDRGTFCYVLWHCDKYYFLTFNRSWFYKFSQIFQVEEEGIGQSFKMRLLNSAAGVDGMLMSMTPKGHAYILQGTKAYSYVEKNSTFRIPSTETEEEGSVPATMLKRLQHSIIC